MTETPRVYTWRYSLTAVTILPVLGLLLSAKPACGLETIFELDPSNPNNNPAAVINYDRFLNDPSFIGSSFNWSGVGQTAGARWATMISPSFFVSANHYHPNVGDTLYFRYSNDPAGGFETRTVLSGNQIGIPNAQQETGDVWLGQLSAPVSAAVAKYPILNVTSPMSGYYSSHPVIYTFGLGTGGDGSSAQRLGSNNIDAATHSDRIQVGGTQQNPIYEDSQDFWWDYHVARSVGLSESHVVSGDSGAPDFVMVNVNGVNMPALVGTNFIQTDDVVNGSGSVLIPYYLSGGTGNQSIKSAMAGSGEEPSLVGLWKGSPQNALVVRKGDFDLDGAVTIGDVQAMLTALNDLSGYESLHGLSDAYTIAMGDFQVDGKLTNADLQGLISYIASGGMGSLSVVPEPSTAALLALGAWPVWRLARRRQAA